jgi:hypothetical protein
LPKLHQATVKREVKKLELLLQESSWRPSVEEGTPKKREGGRWNNLYPLRRSKN